MIGSLYSGISGLKANTSAMAVIGDNIANVDTTGFKSSKGVLCQHIQFNVKPYRPGNRARGSVSTA